MGPNGSCALKKENLLFQMAIPCKFAKFCIKCVFFFCQVELTKRYNNLILLFHVAVVVVFFLL